MKISELTEDLTFMGAGDNAKQGVLICLSSVRGTVPLIIDGPANSGKEFLLRQVLSLLPDSKKPDSALMVSLANEYTGDRAKALIISMNPSEEARVNMLRLQRERRAIEGILKIRQEDYIRNKHIQFHERLQDVNIAIPSTLNIVIGKDVTLLDQAIFLNYMEAVAYLDQETRPKQEREGVVYIEATKEDFYTVKDILINIPVFEVYNSLSPEALELVKYLLSYRDKYPGKEELKREDFVRAGNGKYKTFKPIGHKKRLPELIDAGYINISKKGGYRNIYLYKFSNAFNELDSENLNINRFSGFSLASFSSLAKGG